MLGTTTGVVETGSLGDVEDNSRVERLGIGGDTAGDEGHEVGVTGLQKGTMRYTL